MRVRLPCKRDMTFSCGRPPTVADEENVHPCLHFYKMARLNTIHAFQA